MANHIALLSQLPVEDPLWGYFCPFVGVDGQMDTDELQRCLISSGIAGSYQPFTRQTCFLMIMMLDQSYSGKIGFCEFKEIWSTLNQWKTTFMTLDRDCTGSGTIGGDEVEQAILSSFCYSLSPNTQKVIHSRYSTVGSYTFDDLVCICLRLRMIITQFQQ